jgi:hypothetical protein
MRLSQITKDLAQMQSVVLGRQNFEDTTEAKGSRSIDGAAVLQRAGSIKFVFQLTSFFS